jgi:hypothetical protein
VNRTDRDQFSGEGQARVLSDPALPASAALSPGADAVVGGDETCDPCLRESLRLEANKLAATRMLQMYDNPVLALREYNRFVRDLNISINVHNALCKPHSVRPLSS